MVEARRTARVLPIRLDGLKLASEHVLSDPRLLWGLVGLVGAFRLLLTVIGRGSLGHWDGIAFWMLGRATWTNPASVYPRAAAVLASGHLPGPLVDGDLQPPPQAFLAAPFALLPLPWGVLIWVTTDALCALLALGLLVRVMQVRSRTALPAFWLAVAIFRPLFWDIQTGQRGGLLLLLASGSLAFDARPAIAGALAGLGTALKFYPAALVLAIRPQRRWVFGLTTALTALTAMAITFVPFGSPLFYVRHVLAPTFLGGAEQTDCNQNSLRLLWFRLVGGQVYFLKHPDGTEYRGPEPFLHLPWLAMALTLATAAALVVGVVWSARRSGWNPAFSFSLALGLGALIPGEVFPYQFLPLLPLVGFLVVKSIEQRRPGRLTLLALLVLPFASEPCALFFPSLWTACGLGIYAIAIAGARSVDQIESSLA